MSKGITTRTILLLLVGIIVVGVLVYLLYLYTPSEQLSVYECRVRLIDICTQCSNLDFDSYSLSDTLTTDCSRHNEFSGWNGVDDCKPAANEDQTKDLCKLLGVT